MVDLAEIKRVYRLREKTSLELQKQLELIKESTWQSLYLQRF